MDKSVQLLAAKNNELTVTKLLEIAERSSVNSGGDNVMTNDYEYCKKKKEEEEGGVEGDGIEETFDGPFILPGARPSPNQGRGRIYRSIPRRYFSLYSEDIDALHMLDVSHS